MSWNAESQAESQAGSKQAGPKIDAEIVRLQLDVIAASRPFLLSQRSQAFLRYVVERTLAGSAPKEYEIAVEVLDRAPDYDPAVDATVRVEAGRLRQRLRDYYGGDGKADPVLIEIPKGGYSAEFHIRQQPQDLASAQTKENAAQPELPLESYPHSTPVQPTPNRILRMPRSLLILLLIVPAAAIVAISVWLYFRKHSASPIQSLAVLPLDNLSGNPSEEYFAAGMTDELITELARIPNLRVVSRTSVTAGKEARKTLPEIARELNVDAIVEGSVVRSGNRVRVTAQLIDARDDRHLWADSFEEDLGDTIALQDHVAREIAAHTQNALGSQTSPEVKRIDPVAYDNYLRGLYFIHLRQGRKAVDYFKRAVAIDPSYALAYAGLSMAYQDESIAENESLDATRDPALAAANRAIQLDPNSGEAYTALARFEGVYLQDWAAEGRDVQHALALNPNYSLAEFEYSLYLVETSHTHEAVAHARRALALEPLSFFMNRNLGTMLFLDRQYDESTRYIQRALEIAPDRLGYVYNWLSMIAEMKGNFAEAEQDNQIEFSGYFSKQELDALENDFRHGGWKQYQQGLLKLLLKHRSNGCSDYQIGAAYMELGDRSHAFEWLDRSTKTFCSFMYFIPTNPTFDSLKADPRYRDLLKRMHF